MENKPTIERLDTFTSSAPFIVVGQNFNLFKVSTCQKDHVFIVVPGKSLHMVDLTNQSSQDSPPA